MFNSGIKLYDKAVARFGFLMLQGRKPKQERSGQEAAQMRFQPITDIHLKSNLIQEMGPNSNVLYVYILMVVESLIRGSPVSTSSTCSQLRL
jgi:hypothetical protein